MVLAKDKLITEQGLLSPDLLVMKEESWVFNSSELLLQKYPRSPGEASTWQSTSRTHTVRRQEVKTLKQHKVTAHSQLLRVLLTSMLIQFRSEIAPLFVGNSQFWEKFHKPNCSNVFILMFFENVPFTSL